MCITFKSKIFQDSAKAEENLYHTELLENIHFRQLTVRNYKVDAFVGSSNKVKYLRK